MKFNQRRERQIRVETCFDSRKVEMMVMMCIRQSHRERTSTPVAPFAVAAARLSISIVCCHSGLLDAFTTPDRISVTAPLFPRTLLRSQAAVEEDLRGWLPSGDMRTGAEEDEGVVFLESGDKTGCCWRESYVELG